MWYNSGMAHTKQTPDEIQRNIVHALRWQVAARDDAQVARAIRDHDELDAVYNLDEIGLLDGFFRFLEEMGISALLQAVGIPALERVLIPVTQFVVLYLLKVVCGIESMHALPPLLFSNVAIMTLVGFNAYQIANGFTRRGDAVRKTKTKQGPLTAQCLAANICKIPVTQMETLFNSCIRCLAVAGVFGRTIIAAVDGSKLETTERYEGRGCLRQERQVRDKNGALVTLVEYIFGWKLVALIDVRTRIPLAATVLTIEAYEGAWLLRLLAQAQKNLGAHARIVKVVADRGYLDGATMWALAQQKLVFVLVAKQGMSVREDALALAQRPDAPVVRRETVVRHGHGRTQTEERVVTAVVGIDGLTTYDQYGTPEHTKTRNRKDFAGNPINAVVVSRWENRTFAKGGTVYLTNGPVDNPFAPFDDYDWRSVIENGLFREAKHPWHLKNSPQKNEAGVVVHVFFTLMVMALTTAYRLESQREEETDQDSPQPLGVALLGGEGAQRWRQRLRAENRDKVIVFAGDHYGIFHTAAVMILAGLRVKPDKLPAALGSPTHIFAQYGLGP